MAAPLMVGQRPGKALGALLRAEAGDNPWGSLLWAEAGDNPRVFPGSLRSSNRNLYGCSSKLGSHIDFYLTLPLTNIITGLTIDEQREFT